MKLPTTGGWAYLPLAGGVQIHDLVMCLDSFYYFKDYQNLFEMRKMKDKKKYATRLDWGEIPGLFLLKKVATKLLIFVAT